MPTLRIDEDVFEGLKTLAEPFVDTPNAVIRRLLIEKGILPPKAPPTKSATQAQTTERALTPDLMPQALYEQFLIATLEHEFGGRGEKRRVTQAVIEKMVRNGFIGPSDLELVATGESRAENTITWGRNALKNRGLIARGSPRGVWELTEEGRASAAETVLPKKAKR